MSPNSRNSCHLKIIVKFLLPVLFPIKCYHIKSCVSLFSLLCLFTCIIPLHLSPVVRIDHPITCDGKSPPQTGAFIEIWEIFLTKTTKPSSKSLFNNMMAPRKQTASLNGATSKGISISTLGGTVSPLVVDQSCNHHSNTKNSSFKCSLTWKNKWRSNKPSQIVIESSDSRLWECHLRIGGIETAQQPTPNPNCCPPK